MPNNEWGANWTQDTNIKTVGTYLKQISLYYKKIGNHYIVRGSFSPAPSVTIPVGTAFATGGSISGMGAICYSAPYASAGVCCYLNGIFITNSSNTIINQQNAYAYLIII
jgi:hypothetical protein